MDRCLQLLANLGCLADAVAQVVQLGAADIAVAHGLDLLDRGRVDRENLFHADAVGQAADGDGLFDAAVLLGDDGALEDLNTLTGAFLDLHVDANGVAHQDLGDFLQLLLVQCFDEIHGYFLLNYRCSCRHLTISAHIRDIGDRGPPFSRHDRIA